MKQCLVLFSFLITLTLQANPVDQETAAKAAMFFIKGKLGDARGVNISSNVLISNSGTPCYYVVNFSGGGWVIVSAHDFTPPVLAYSTDGYYDSSLVSPQEKGWMKQYQQVITQLASSPEKHTQNPGWQMLLSGKSVNAVKQVSPLCTAIWSQGCYYNELCPADTAGPCDHAVTGCVATAMGIIMKYWEYPQRGSGVHSYSHPTYGNITADFGNSVYEWALMPDSLAGPCLPAALLLHHCGVSCNMNYGPYESGGGLMASGFENYFRYSQNAQNVYKSGYTEQEWIEMLIQELDEGRPLLYAGYPDLGFPVPGHAWVVDGYEDSLYFHFNWGWGSTGGYYVIGGYFYSANNEAVKGIMPVATCDISMQEMTAPVAMTFHVPHAIRIRLANYDTVGVSNIPVCYLIDGTTLVQDTIFGTLAPMADTVFQFLQPYNFPVQPGHTFEIKVFSNLFCDAYKGNDTLTYYIENVPCASPVYSMGFEPTENVNGWFTEDIHQDGGWNRINNSGNLGPYCMGISTQGMVNDDYFFSRCLDLEAGKVYKLTFFYRNFAAWASENLAVYIGDSCSSAAMFQQIGTISGFSNTQWQEAGFYFTVPANGWYYMGWHCFSGTDGLIAFVDDILITEQTATDVAVTRWHEAQGGCDLGDMPVTVTVRNLCSQILADIPISCFVNGSLHDSGIIAGNLNPGDSVVYTFSTPVSMTSTADYAISVFASCPGDTIQNNDTLSVTVHHVIGSTAPYAMGFEATDDFSHWTAENLNNDIYTWTHVSSGGHNSTGCMRYDYSSFLDADDWLISDCFSLSSSEVYRLGFWTKIESSQWPEDLAVYFGTQPTHIAMTQQLADLPDLSNESYVQTFIDFTVPSDTQYYFGFYCYSPVLMFNLYIDDVTLDIVTSGNEDKLTAMGFSLYPNPAGETITLWSDKASSVETSYTVVNTQGKVLLTGSVTGNETMVPVSMLESGMYYVKIRSENMVLTRKFCKL